MVEEASQTRLWLIERLEVSEQKSCRTVGMDSGSHICDIAPVTLREVEFVEPRPGIEVLQLVAQGDAHDVDRCVSSIDAD